MTPGTLVIVALIIAGVWAALLGTAYGVQVAGYGRGASLAAVTACYLALAACALLWLGPTPRGWLGAIGMLAPYSMAVALTVYARPRLERPRS